MESAPDAVEASSAAFGRRVSVGRKALTEAIARIPLPIRAKQLVGSLVVAALLALVAVLGLVALGQSNTRGDQLLRLQAQAVGLQVVLTDAARLKRAIELRIDAPPGPGFAEGFGPGIDEAIKDDMSQLCVDASLDCTAGERSLRLFRLAPVDPQAFRLLEDKRPLFYRVINADAGDVTWDPATLRRTDRFATSFAARISADARATRARANDLVAANQSSFASSRNLLIGVGAGSLALALALGLLLSDSFVLPLRRTQRRLAMLAAGAFSGQLEVPNRDEIGALAADVNRMSDELQRAYRELELTSERKSQYVTNMSHELRTPLNAIIGFSEVLHEQMFGRLNERQLAYVGDVLEAGKHLLSLINDLLDLAKIEAGKMELELSEVGIPDVLRGAVSMQHERAGSGGIELELTTEPDEISVTADEKRVRQVVFNLVSNAIKFTPPQGRINVSARLDDGHVEIAVADTGPGIAPEEVDTIFEEFEQTSDGRKVEGTGLGLPLSRKLVELHGGRLWVESRIGEGSTFRFTLPVEQQT